MRPRAGQRAVVVLFAALCTIGLLVFVAPGHLGVAGGFGWVSLEGPWTPEGEEVMKPGLTFNEMNQLHAQVQQARWASRFGSNVPKQVVAEVLALLQLSPAL